MGQTSEKVDKLKYPGEWCDHVQSKERWKTPKTPWSRNEAKGCKLAKTTKCEKFLD